MNHIYRSLWNAKTGTFVAVSEIVTSGKKASEGGGVVGGVFALKALAVSLLLGFGSTSYALPVGGVVVAFSFVIDLTFLHGRQLLVGSPVDAIVEY